MLRSLKAKNFIKIDFVRNFKKKILPAHPDHADHIPGEQYQKKSSHETSVFAWGLSEHGALGHYISKRHKMRNRNDFRFKKYIKPFRHTIGEHFRVKDIAAGYGFTVFSVSSSSQNKVWGSGINTDSQLGYHDVRRDHPLGILLSPVPINLNLKSPGETKVIGMSAGRAHLVIVTDSEGVFTLGNNSYGQCGRSVIEDEKYFGSRIIHNMATVGGEKVVSVECGQDHTLFLTDKGHVYSCGWGADGQTGLGHYSTEPRPTRVLGDIEGENIVKLSSKSDCVLAINDKGDVFGWGNSEYSQIFDEKISAQQINRPIHMKKCKGFGKIVDVAAAGSYCMMLNEAGEVFTWGYGILGRGPVASQSWQPALIPPILFGKTDFQPECKVSKIFCGLSFSAAINSFGHIYTWGKNRSYCLGLGFEKDQFFPLRVHVGATARKLALGVDHAVALCNPF